MNHLTETIADHKSEDNQLCAVSLLGNLVAKPDIRYRANPVLAVTELILATHSKWFDKNKKKFNEWTSYHPIQVIGPLVEQTLLQAQKGDLILIHGYLSQNMIRATFIQKFAKGYSQSINQIHCSGIINSPISLIKTEQNKEFAQASILINHQEYSPVKQTMQKNVVERMFHVWGKQALLLHEKAQQNDKLVIEGKLNYSADADKTQFIEAKNIHLFKN